MKTFVSFSSADLPAAEAFVELLRLHYIDFFYSERSLRGGYFEENLEKAIAECHKFVVLLSPQSLDSKWVQKEVAIAMNSPHLRGNILPVLIAETPNWEKLHPNIGWLQVFDHFRRPYETETRLIEEEFNRPRHQYPYYRVGDVTIQVLILAGGNGETRYRTGDILCDGPKEDRTYQLPDDIQLQAAERLAEFEARMKANKKLVFNNRQVRLQDATWGGPSATGGMTEKPLHLTLGWTDYYKTRLTNQTRDFELPCGNSIALKYGRDLTDLAGSGLSNPIATNMSVVSRDRQIFLATRSNNVAWNPGGFQPAVSGDGQLEDLDESGTYNPFLTAIREGREECLGRYRPTLDEVTFFGLARTMGTQFPFLFGEIRVDRDAADIGPPLNPEGHPFSIPFTVDGVCDWVRKYHRDHFEGRRGGVIGTTLFSLLQSLHYEYPEEWPEVVRRLRR